MRWSFQSPLPVPGLRTLFTWGRLSFTETARGHMKGKSEARVAWDLCLPLQAPQPCTSFWESSLAASTSAACLRSSRAS